MMVQLWLYIRMTTDTSFSTAQVVPVLGEDANVLAETGRTGTLGLEALTCPSVLNQQRVLDERIA